ncbi:hypothetical protein FOL47_001197 [Perkinsus chesapeaki]|uniref:Uncharacterized protein n=1 Tax=Perkinsus chesapeaki TaxID=330153 RepID=A0A7J6MK10_PERCH|nr:hypothetical protein FOL47_001197 [Perkinsus chesapeaki]
MSLIEEIKDAGDLMSFGTFLDYCRRCRTDTPKYSLDELLEFCKSLSNDEKDGVLPVKVIRNLLGNVGEPLDEIELENFTRDFADSRSDSVDCAHMLRRELRASII